MKKLVKELTLQIILNIIIIIMYNESLQKLHKKLLESFKKYLYMNTT